jgi:hypothetical protein
LEAHGLGNLAPIPDRYCAYLILVACWYDTVGVEVQNARSCSTYVHGAIANIRLREKGFTRILRFKNSRSGGIYITSNISYRVRPNATIKG